jgi:MoxR-like ATPase
MTTTNPNAWYIFDGTATAREDQAPDTERLRRLPPPPPWRRLPHHGGDKPRAFLPDDTDLQLVNAALCLRRPLLITGKPGSGKTTLAEAVARELGLGPVLRWSITSRSTLQDGLYQYDAVARLQDIERLRQNRDGQTPEPTDIGRYLTLGPLGTAFYGIENKTAPEDANPEDRYFPRVLLIDEIDKSDIDLPNDLLHVLEEYRFEIPELVRLKEQQQAPVQVRGWGAGAEKYPIEDGEVRCRAFPLVFMTSNGEREFPPAFLRRCLRLRMQPPDKEKLQRIIAAHLAPEPRHQADIDKLIDEFLHRRKEQSRLLATDQLLNAVALTIDGVDLAKFCGLPADDSLLDGVLKPLDDD